MDIYALQSPAAVLGRFSGLLAPVDSNIDCLPMVDCRTRDTGEFAISPFARSCCMCMLFIISLWLSSFTISTIRFQYPVLDVRTRNRAASPHAIAAHPRTNEHGNRAQEKGAWSATRLLCRCIRVHHVGNRTYRHGPPRARRVVTHRMM